MQCACVFMWMHVYACISWKKLRMYAYCSWSCSLCCCCSCYNKVCVLWELCHVSTFLFARVSICSAVKCRCMWIFCICLTVLPAAVTPPIKAFTHRIFCALKYFSDSSILNAAIHTYRVIELDKCSAVIAVSQAQFFWWEKTDLTSQTPEFGKKCARSLTCALVLNK